MSAHTYHFCQACKQTVSPQISDDRLKERFNELVAQEKAMVELKLLPVGSLDVPTEHHVWSDSCLKCGPEWPLVLLRVGREPLARMERVSKVLDELLPKPDRVGWQNRYANYKKLQQANSKRRNPVRGHEQTYLKKGGYQW